MIFALLILYVLALVFAVAASLSEAGKPYQWVAVVLVAIAGIIQHGAALFG